MRSLHALPFALVFGLMPISHTQADTKHGAHAMPSDAQVFGVPGDASAASRTIAVTMDDTMRFVPAAIRVKQGETVTLAIRNNGKLMHELVLGSAGELAHHAQMMRDHAGMGHTEPYMAHVKPGELQKLTWRFSKAGTFEFACLVPGHYEAGMKGVVTVAGAAASGQ